MKTLKLSNSTVNTIDNYCDSSLELSNNYSNIRNINIFNSLSSLSGKYNCNINIYESTYLYLHDSFTLNYQSICFIGNDISTLNIVIEGNLNNFNKILNITSTGNINFTNKLLSNNTSKSKIIKILLKDKINSSSTFSLSSGLSNKENNIQIILYPQNYNKLIINSDIYSINFIGCKNIEFTIVPNIFVFNFLNVNKNTFKFLNSTLEIISLLKKQYPHINFKIKSILFNSTLLNGKSAIIVPKNIPIPENTSILINNVEYPLKFSNNTKSQ